MNVKMAVKWILALTGIVVALWGVIGLASAPASNCIIFIIFPLVCSGPGPFWWIGALLTTIVGLALLWFARRL